MSWPIWPESLNRWEREGWQASLQESRLRRSGDAGPPGWRRRFSSAARSVALSIVLERDEKAMFDHFYEHTCKHGSLLFWMPDPTTDGWSMLDASGQPLFSGEAPVLLSARWLCSWGDQVPVETITEQVKFRKIFNVMVMP